MGALVQQANTAAERERIYQFRYQVYVEEMGKLLPDADHERRILKDEFDAQAVHLYIERDGVIAGSLRMIWGRDGWPSCYPFWYGLALFNHYPPETISFTGRLMVAHQYRNTPFGASLAREIYRIGRDIGVLFDFIHTTPPLIPFFERLGHRRYKADFLDPHLGPRTPMLLVLQDIPHLESCKSPFLNIARRCENQPDSGRWFQRAFFQAENQMHNAITDEHAIGC